MLDPIPPPAPWLSRAVQPVADRLGLYVLPGHVHEVLAAFLLYQFIQSAVSPVLSAKLFPNVYPKFNQRTRINWDVHVVSLVQSCLICVSALWVVWTDRERKAMNSLERVWGYTGSCGLIGALGAGYFVWDFIVSLRYVKLFGLGVLGHAVCSLCVFSMGLRPYLQYYGSVFILYELSTPFLNIHWFCDKLNLTGSRIQWYNGIMLLTTFAGCRLIWGTYSSIRVYQDIWTALHIPADQTVASAISHVVSPAAASRQIFGSKDGSVCLGDTACVAAQAETLKYIATAKHLTWPLALTTFIPNLFLNGLNFFWFSKMINTVKSRFEGKPDPSYEPRDESVFVDGDVASLIEQVGKDVPVNYGKTTEVEVDGVAGAGDARNVTASGLDDKGAQATKRK